MQGLQYLHATCMVVPEAPIPCRPLTGDMLSGPVAPGNSSKGCETVAAGPPVLTPDSMKKKKQGKTPGLSRAGAMPAGPLAPDTSGTPSTCAKSTSGMKPRRDEPTWPSCKSDDNSPQLTWAAIVPPLFTGPPAPSREVPFVNPGDGGHRNRVDASGRPPLKLVCRATPLEITAAVIVIRATRHRRYCYKGYKASLVHKPKIPAESTP